jgi:hypothetical protein
VRSIAAAPPNFEAAVSPAAAAQLRGFKLWTATAFNDTFSIDLDICDDTPLPLTSLPSFFCQTMI